MPRPRKLLFEFLPQPCDVDMHLGRFQSKRWIRRVCRYECATSRRAIECGGQSASTRRQWLYLEWSRRERCFGIMGKHMGTLRDLSPDRRLNHGNGQCSIPIHRCRRLHPFVARADCPSANTMAQSAARQLTLVLCPNYLWPTSTR
jgi:hypothetical protein